MVDAEYLLVSEAHALAAAEKKGDKWAIEYHSTRLDAMIDFAKETGQAEEAERGMAREIWDWHFEGRYAPYLGEFSEQEISTIKGSPEFKILTKKGITIETN